MSPFCFSLAPTEAITPWDRNGSPELSWFALTDGRFWIALGDQELFRYAPQLLEHGSERDPHPDYQVAAFVRDVLGSAAAACTSLPPALQRLAADWERLADLHRDTRRLVDEEDSDEASDLWYSAWRWLGERSPWMSYLSATPRFSFVRLDGPDRIRVGFDNRGCMLEGHDAWTARLGHFDFDATLFEAELRSLPERLLAAMADRLDDLETGRASCQAPIDLESLRAQHLAWAAEFRGYFEPRAPDLGWERSLSALRELAARYALTLPFDP